VPQPFTRQHHAGRLQSEDFDLLVIGGGITGAGVALDAVTRGLRVALVEMDDFASGTSSKSSKLIHGGLRYLQQGDVRLVYEALHERRRLMRNAPHLVKVLPFMIPILTKDGLMPRRIARALGSSLWMYDLTGGWRIGKFHRRLRAKKALKHFPTMPAEKLASAYIYYDAQADDARLAVEVLRTASDHGAVILNYAKVVGLTKDDSGRVNGARVAFDNQEIVVRARTVVSATGVWIDDVLQMETNSVSKSVRPAKGVHLTFAWEKIRNDIAAVIPVPKDRRSLFVVPWIENPDGTFKYTYVGTTDTQYDGPVNDPQCTLDDIDYVIAALNNSITTPVSRDDVLGVWAGLRPLLAPSEGESIKARTADLSRRHRVSVGPSGVISVSGGKLTTYREMAEDTVDQVVTMLGKKTKCRTKRLAIHASSTPTETAALVPGLPLTHGEVVRAVREEMAIHLADVMCRRSRALLYDRETSVQGARVVAELMARELGWDAERVNQEVAHFLTICEREETAARVTEPEYLGHGS
jgi:glycerol-3-phosphate dehydrogenase